MKPSPITSDVQDIAIANLADQTLNLHNQSHSYFQTFKTNHLCSNFIIFPHRAEKIYIFNSLPY
jgi:hypothetical protein